MKRADCQMVRGAGLGSESLNLLWACPPVRYGALGALLGLSKPQSLLLASTVVPLPVSAHTHGCGPREPPAWVPGSQCWGLEGRRKDLVFYLILFCIVSIFGLWTYIKFTVLAIFKCAIQEQQVHSHCCSAITTIHPLNSSSCQTETL